MSQDIIKALETGEIDPNAREVAFVSFQCRTCDKHGPWVSVDDRENPDGAWDARHTAEVGHARFYMWTIKRNTAEVYTPKYRNRGGRDGS